MRPTILAVVITLALLLPDIASAACGITLDQSTAPAPSGVVAASSTNMASVTSGDLIIAAVSSQGQNPTIDSGFSILDQGNDPGVGTDYNTAYLIQGTAGAINPTWTATGNPYWSAGIAAYKAAAGGGGTATIIQPKLILGLGRLILSGGRMQI